MLRLAGRQPAGVHALARVVVLVAREHGDAVGTRDDGGVGDAGEPAVRGFWGDDQPSDSSVLAMAARHVRLGVWGSLIATLDFVQASTWVGVASQRY